jgi:membrane protease YdiL (CAAX protease family)
VIAFAASWGLGAIGLSLPALAPATAPFSHTSIFYWLAAYSVSITGIVLTGFYEGRAGLVALAGRCAPWRAGIVWYAVVIGGYVAITALALLIGRTLNMPHPRIAALPALVTGAMTTLLIDVGPIGEEFGWRGFALPRLLAHRSPITATMILGVVHAVWHLPLFFIPGLTQHALSFPVHACGVVALAVINTWIYSRTNGSMVLAILIHLMSNYCGGVLGPDAFPASIAAEVLAAIAVVAGGGLSKPRQ